MVIDKPETPTYDHLGMMKRTLRFLALSLVAVTVAGFTPTEARAQGRLAPPRNDGPPVLDFASVSPSAGYQLNKSIMVSGSVSDDVGIREVLYRIHGSKKWRQADLVETASDDNTRQTTGADFYFRLKLTSGGNTRVDVRVIDIRNQESEFLTRRFRYARSENDIPSGETEADYPELDEGSIMPAAGLNLDKIITVSGDATTRSTNGDPGSVEYRFHGSKRWRKATVGEAEPIVDNGTITGFRFPFFFRVKLSSSNSTRVVIKVIDDEGRESDYFTRRFQYDKYKRSLIREPSAPVDPTPEPPIVAPFQLQSGPASSSGGAESSSKAQFRPIPADRPYGVKTRKIVR